MVIQGLLENKVAVVTGGTRGIGLAIVHKFLEQGATVVLFGSRQETADAAVTIFKTELPDYPVVLHPILVTTPVLSKLSKRSSKSMAKLIFWPIMPVFLPVNHYMTINQKILTKLWTSTSKPYSTVVRL